MNLAAELERTEFHDSDLPAFVFEDDTLRLQFHNIILEIGTEEHYSALVILHGVREMRRFGVVVPTLAFEGEDCEVLQFHRGDGRASLLVSWNYYARPRRLSEYVEYQIDYASSEVTAEKQDGLIL